MNARFIVVFALLACARFAAAEPVLRHDPFRTPAPAPAPVAAAAEPAAPPRVLAWHATLRAVLVDGERSLANVDGVMVPLGKEVDGFRLVEVADGRAVFVRDGQRFTLTTHPAQSTP